MYMITKYYTLTQQVQKIIFSTFLNYSVCCPLRP